MAHEIYVTRNGKASMAFAGQTPWHGLGNPIKVGADLETVRQAAGFDWQAKLTPVLFRPDGHTAPLTYTGKSVVYRDDTGDALGTVGDDYKIVQPAEVLEFFRDLTESNDWHIHTAGVLRGGRKLWALARNHTEGDVTPGDTVRGNLLLATSMDGSMRTHCGMTGVSIVCANTLAAALASDGHKMMKVSHRSVFDPEAVKADLGIARESFELFMERARKLAASPIGQTEARDILRTLFGRPVALEAAPVATTGGTIDGSEFAQLLARPVDAKQPKEHRNVVRVLELFNGAGRGANHPGRAGTAWGLLNGVTEFVDHEQGRTQDGRLDAAWFGKGADLKSQAMATLLAAV